VAVRLAWHAGEPMQSHYLQMIVGIYVTLGVFLYRARTTRSPPEPDLVHGVVEHRPRRIMAVQAVVHPGNLGHLLGDVPALFVVAAVLAWLTPRCARRSQSLNRPRRADAARR